MSLSGADPQVAVVPGSGYYSQNPNTEEARQLRDIVSVGI